tara:strand:+ start:1037 stop:1291 length:255 start_codon:yes stop_codon:yes gene_type:complete
MKKLIILLFIFVGCSSNKNTAYSVEMTLGNGDVITRHYILEDGSKLFLKNRRGNSFLVYDKKDITRYPFILKKNVVSFKLKKTK